MAYINIKDLTIDKEFEDLLPVLAPEELEKLENSILQYGMLDPIKIWQEPNTGEWIIIDGHNRYNILKKHNIDWHYWQDYKIMTELETREDVKQWMLEQQLGRRNLSDVERYEIVQKFKSVFQRKAKENQSLGGKGVPNLVKVNVQEEMAKVVGVSKGSYHKLDKVMQSDNEELKQQLREKKVSTDKAYQEIKHPKPKKEEIVTPGQKIIEFDNRMNEIDREISSLKSERETLMRRRSRLFETLDIPCELKYEFAERDRIGFSRDCIFYVEIDGHKQIFVTASVYSDESPLDSWSFIMSKIPEKYKNDFIMLWKKAHNEEVAEFNRRLDEWNKKHKETKLTISKEFYKKCFRILAKNFHPDNEDGSMEDMQYLNQLKIMCGI